MTTRIHYLLIFTFVTLTALIAACSKSDPPESASMTTSSATVNVSDRDVNEHVKTVLNQNAALKAFDIQVITLKGDVRLIGIVDTQAHIDEALKIARAAEGTHTIHNELTLKK